MGIELPLLYLRLWLQLMNLNEMRTKRFTASWLNKNGLTDGPYTFERVDWFKTVFDSKIIKTTRLWLGDIFH